MGCGNQPVFNALEDEKDERSLTNKPSGADGGGGWTHGAHNFEEDIMSLPFNSLGYDHFPGRDMQEYEVPPADLSMKGHGANFQMIPAVNPMDYGKSEITMNFNRPRCETGPGYPIKTHGAEAQNSRSSQLRMSGQFSSSESSTSLLPLVDNFGATGNEYDTNLVPLSTSSPQNIDRNFLTLGIGGGIGVRPNSNFSTRQVSNKLEEVSSQINNPIVGYYPKNPSSRTQLAGQDARIQTNAGGLSRPGSDFSARKIPSKLEEVSSQFNNSNIGQCPKNPLSLTQLSGGAAMIQTNTGGLSRPAGNLASRNASHAEGALIGDTGFRLNSVPFSGLQTLQANLPSNTPKCYSSASKATPLLLPSGSTLFSQPICSSQPEINSTNHAIQPISWPQDYSRKISMKVLSESYRNHLSHRHQLSSISHVQPGNLSLAEECTRKEVAKIGSFPSNAQPVGQFDVYNASPIIAPGNYISPERIGVQVSKSSTDQSAATGHFPRRLGLQPNDIATAPSARGPSSIHLAAYSNQFRPMAHTTGQYLQHQHGMPAQSSSVFPGVDSSYGQVAPIISVPPPLKRKVANSSVLSGQPKKLLRQPVINDSTLQQRQIIPANPAAVHIPPAPLHVKWKGFDEPPEPTGQRCLLCKRDLSFTAEGVMYQPTAPLPVAVLPCGHTFHDHCLHIITPADQLKSPPCIPCAVGET